MFLRFVQLCVWNLNFTQKTALFCYFETPLPNMYLPRYLSSISLSYYVLLTGFDTLLYNNNSKRGHISQKGSVMIHLRTTPKITLFTRKYTLLSKRGSLPYYPLWKHRRVEKQHFFLRNCLIKPLFFLRNSNFYQNGV